MENKETRSLAGQLEKTRTEALRYDVAQPSTAQLSSVSVVVIWALNVEGEMGTARSRLMSAKVQVGVSINRISFGILDKTIHLGYKITLGTGTQRTPDPRNNPPVHQTCAE